MWYKYKIHVLINVFKMRVPVPYAIDQNSVACNTTKSTLQHSIR